MRMKRIAAIIFLLSRIFIFRAYASEGDLYGFRPIDECVGEKFLFHSKPKSLQRFYYTNIFKTSSGISGEKELHPKYKECVGRTATIIDAVQQDNGVYEVMIRMDDDGTVYRVEAREGSMEGLVSLTDIENVRRELKGKKFWYLKEAILSYDEKSGEYHKVYAGRYSRVEIIDAAPSWSTTAPIRLMIETAYDETGYVEVNMSGTNVPKNVRGNERFEFYFSTQNPKRWPENIKNLIARNMIRPGMSREQVLMSWGRPYEVVMVEGSPSVKEKWIYPYGDLLYFVEGVLERTGKE